MRPGQSNKRSRGRGRKGPSPLSRSYESNGPDVKIRGTAQHIADKYINLARDAQSSGDTVLSEAYYQHAEHFYRIVAAAQQQMNQPINVKRADDPIDTDDSSDRDGFDPSDPDAPQPDANADGNGRDDNRRDRDDDGDGERRSRRNRGRQRRGRGDDNRDEDVRADNGRGGRDRDDRAGEDAARNEDRPPEDTPARDAAPAEQESNGEAAERPRRVPRQRKANVDVADRFEDGDAQSDGQVERVADAPKPVTLGDDVAPVQATSDET